MRGEDGNTIVAVVLRHMLPRDCRRQQGEQIVNLALTEDEAAAVILTCLGPRVQGVHSEKNLRRARAGAGYYDRRTRDAVPEL